MRRRLLAGVVVAAVLVVTLLAERSVHPTGTATAAKSRTAGLTALQQRLVSGTASPKLDEQTQSAALRRPGTRVPGDASDRGCPADRGSNVRVNQDCQNLTDGDLSGRGQAQNETAVASDPNESSSLVASSNDYRRGDAGCVTYYSGDSGRSWRDSTPPMTFTRGATFGGTRQYWQVGGDTSVAWDTRGNAYLSCLLFMRGAAVSANPDLSSGLYVFRSTASRGASWNFPARPVAEFADTAGTRGAMLDKQYMTIDNHDASPFRDRIYVTWTFFQPDGTAYIYAAHSADYGERFSQPTLVSADSSLCAQTLGAPTPQGRCNANQFSQPFTGPDGALYVVWNNFNATDFSSKTDNRGQVLLAKSTDGGATFSAPVKVADYYELPDCLTYQGKSPGVACVPEKGATTNSYFRAANYPSGAVSPVDADKIVVTFGSYINGRSNDRNGCVPRGFNTATLVALYDGVKAPGACNNDILASVSGDAGRTFTGGSADVRALTTVRPDDSQTDQFWQWAAFDPSGRLAVSYYDRAYGDDEMTGFSDVSLSGSRDGSDYAVTRVTTGSMPPPTQLGGSFFGDYSALTADSQAHPVWMDTRDEALFACRDASANVTLPPTVCTQSADNAELANDQNIYTTSLAIPLP